MFHVEHRDAGMELAEEVVDGEADECCGHEDDAADAKAIEPFELGVGHELLLQRAAGDDRP